jgi:hypothetical protein
VDDINAARKDLIARGVEVSEIFHYAEALQQLCENPRVGGATLRVVPTFVCLVRGSVMGTAGAPEITTRLPAANGSRRELKHDAATLAELLRETWSTTIASRRRTSSIIGGTGTAISRRASERCQLGGGHSRRRPLHEEELHVLPR